MNKDTLSLVYTVDSTGRVKDVTTTGKNNAVCQLLSDKAKKSMRWMPARTNDWMPINMVTKENVVTLSDDAGRVFFLTSIPYTACYNSADAPEDSTVIIANPAEPTLYTGETSIEALISKKLSREKRVKYEASFIVELDGSISELETEVTHSGDDTANQALKELLAQTHWKPARQGGKDVRSRHSVSGFWLKREQASDYYPNFMTGGSRPPFCYDPLYDKSLQKRWRKLQDAYPELQGIINGYAKVRKMDSSTYQELMMRKGR